MNNKKRKKDSQSYIYIGVDSRESNESKVGMTTRNPKARESETTNPYYSIETAYPLYVNKVALSKIEAAVHLLLTEKFGRIKHTATGKNSEWFSCSPAEARIIIENYLEQLPKSQREGTERKLRAKKGSSERMPSSSRANDALDITAQVIKDCVNRNTDKSSLTYQYESLYFRCPECKTVTRQNTVTMCTCSECNFDIVNFSQVDEVSMALRELENAVSMNSRQAALFDIYNAIFSYQVRQTNLAFEKKKAAQIQERVIKHSQKTVLPQGKVHIENTSTPNKFYKLLIVYILVSLTLSLFFLGN
ncbi:GIY-YIG nuclease family protein [Vibrio atlanticus]|uniref:GIY-YIG nuclease family protein n=1 Tax=Vibrio atlanticus TaxID=693153 RepID=UPI0022AEB3A3|nr:GIY-YIG nuclease family protein [Vibrio atlanticus]MCZ4311628.1 GIY-YIG nuclease family protein [Vibrio atlanticus]